MAITPKKVSVTGTSTVSAPLDSNGILSIAWTESKTAGANVFNVDITTAAATLALTGTSGDIVKINGYSGDYSAMLSGTKLTLQSNTQSITVSLTKASTVKLSFADGDKIVDVAGKTLGTQALTSSALHVYGVTAHEAATKTAYEAALAVAKTTALTDLSGHKFATVDEAITSNDTAAINAAISKATGARFTTVTDLAAAYSDNATPTFSVVAGADAKEGTNASFTVNLSSAQTTAMAVNLVFNPVGGASAADIDLNHITVPAGFTLSDGVLTFPAKATTATVTIPIVSDSISPENGEGFTLALTNATGSAKVSSSAASAKVNLIDVPPSASPVIVSISPSNASVAATAGADTFNIVPGNYNASITGFGIGDTLAFDVNSSQAITNTSGSDGFIVITGSLNFQQVVLTLAGVNPILDSQVFSLASFAKAFAPAVSGSSTTTNISASANLGAGTSGVDVFNIASGNYSASIAGFGANDKLVFTPGTVETITNTSTTDGNITVAGVLNNQLVTIQLTGVSTALDAQVFNVSSFNTAFGTGSLV